MLSYTLRNIEAGSTSILSATHCLMSLKFLSLRCSIKSAIATSLCPSNIPLSITPKFEYLCNSLSVRLKSGKYAIINSARTGRSEFICSTANIDSTLCINWPARASFSFFGIANSITLVLECNGSIIRFLKLQVSINLQFAENSSINPRNAGCVDCGLR